MFETAGPQAWLTALVMIAGLIGLRYVLIAGGALALTRLFARRLAPRRIQLNPVSDAQLRREALYSLSTIFVFAAVFLAVFAFNRYAGGLQIYRDFDDRGWIWWFCSIVIGLIIHDFYFYWAHRFMHLPGVFERIHRVHHLSTNPSPLAAFAFHPAEAVIEALVIVVIAATIPVHPSALLVIGVYSLIMNVIGHLGFELFPASWHGHPVLRFLNTATSHKQHHATFRYNFGLYSLIWDRMFGTLHPKYADLYSKVTDPDRAPPLPTPAP
jgi:sterol desaturase/sphingolipid hydroxylase (fatty acid hydroxylase superfamily)